MTLDEYFEGAGPSRALFDALLVPMEDLRPFEFRVTKSQVAFSRARAFAWAWMPGGYLGPGHAPLVLSVSLPRRDTSPRWKQVVEPSPGRFMHHLELYSPDQLDAELQAWLQEAFNLAG